MNFRSCSIGKQLSPIWAVAMFLIVFSVSCTSRKGSKNQGRFSADDVATVHQVIPFNQDPFRGVEASPLIASILNDTFIHKIDADLLWALAHCNCSPTVNSKYLQRLSTTYGALPETLVPDVRETILNDPKLKILDRVPGGLKDIGDFFVGLYVTDGKIAEQVKTSVDEMIQKSVPSASALSQSLPYRFDLYSNLSLPQDIRRPTTAKMFSTGDQAVIWSHIFSQPNIWEAKEPLAFGDHGFQFFMTLKTLAEWKYLFGLDKAQSTGRIYGGLTLDPLIGAKNSPVAAYDPRLQPAPPARFVSGQYTVRYPDMKALDQATKTNEVWETGKTHASLTELSMILYSAAKAFQRMRPRNQQNVRSMFENSGGVIPENAYTLPIAFLPGTAKVLENALINQETLNIYQIADAPARVENNRLRADISAISRLIMAMGIWVDETRDISDLQVSASIRDQLTSGHATMKKVLRLAVQNMLASFVREDHVNRNGFGIMMVKSVSDLSPPTLAQTAEALNALATVEQELLDSPFLRQRIYQLYHWMAGTYFSPMVRGGMMKFTASDVVWTKKALARFGNYPFSNEAVWYKSAYETISNQLSGWDGRVP